MQGMQQPFNPSQGVVWTKDPRRNQFCQPGQLIYSAKMDPSGIACFHRCVRGQCCCLENIVSRTFVDVYSNGVLLSTPFRMCYCDCDHATMAYYDRRMFTDAVVEAGCCRPCPYFCPHVCGLFGDALAFPGGCCGYPDSNAGHCFVSMGCFFPVFLMYGLAPGEGLATAMIINNEIAKFRSGPYKEPVTNAPQTVQIMAAPTVVMMQSPMNQGYQQPQQQQQPEGYGKQI